MPRLLLALLLTVAVDAAAQGVPSTDEGRPLLSQHVSWQDYGANSQNWAVAQREDGRIYVANTGGILEHDGADWRLYSMSVDVRALVHSLAVGRSGRIFVGGIGDVGYLAGDESGTLAYRSLRPYIPEADRGFTDVWTAHATRAGIVFQSYERLFRWDGRRMEVWRTDTRFRSSFLVRGTVHVWEDGVGLKTLGPRGLTVIPGGEAFADRKVDALLPYGRGFLAVVRDEGLVVIEPNGASRALEGPASEYLRTFRPYTAVAVPDLYTGRGVLYAIATFGGGVVVVTPRGQIVRVYREDVGMTEGDDALGLMPDRQGGLWVALQNGITRIDLFARHTWFDQQEGVIGSQNAIAEHDGVVFAATDAGLFRQVTGRLGAPGATGPAYTRFEPVVGIPGSRGQVWDVQSTPAGLLVAAHDGVYALGSGRPRKVLDVADAFTIVPVSRRPDRMFVGTRDGLLRLALRGGRWVADGSVAGIEGETRFMQEDVDGAMWVSQPGGGLHRIPNPAADRPAVQTFSPADGLTATPGPLNLVGRHLLLSTREGVYRVERTGARIRLVREAAFSRLGGAYSLFVPEGAAPWTYENGSLRSGAGIGFQMGGIQPADLLIQRSGVAWVATSDGLLRYDPRVRLGRRTYPALIRRVTDRQLRVLYGGAYGLQPTNGVDLEVPIRAVRALRFEYAAALFDRPGRTEFSTRLLGSDDETWSPWGAERVAQFIGIREGTYAFEVRARDDLGRLSTTARFRVRILPPWYRTWWAYALYGMALTGFIWGVTAWRLRKQRLRLEAARARNARMQRLGARLQETNTRLRHADKLKDDLLANTSHELRTPLTAILGFSEMLLDEAAEEVRDLAEGIQRGGQRLLDTVNGLLDMFKLQSGTMEVFVQEVDAAAAVRETARLLAPLAARRGLTLRVLPDGLSMPAALDCGAFERILTNLVGNAIKFTAVGGVTVLVDGTDHDLVVTVTDTGIGIPPEMVDQVFEPFEQASTGFSRSHEGSGLGLAIVRRLVDLVGGTIEVESVVGEGTTVQVTLPRWGDLHPSTRRIAGAASNPALGGAQLLALGLGDDARLVRDWIEPRGTVCTVETPGQAVREAKKMAYDAVFVGAASPEAERKRVALLRNVPGYVHLPVLRVGGEALETDVLAARGFTHQLPLPLDADAVVTLLEVLLMKVEESVDD